MFLVVGMSTRRRDKKVADEEDDPVVEEYNVRLVFPEQGTFDYVQYPVPSNVYKSKKPCAAKFRPENAMLELKYDTEDWRNSSYYDLGFATKAGLPADHTRKFTSTKVDLRTQYVFGQLHGDTMIVTPISNVLSMRPDFSHVSANDDEDDKASSAVPDSNQNSAAGGTKPEISDSASRDGGSSNPSNGSIRVNFQKLQTSRTLAAKERSYNTLLENKTSEPWINLEVQKDDGTEGLASFMEQSECWGKLKWNVKPSEYLNSIVPKSTEVLNDDSDIKNLAAATTNANNNFMTQSSVKKEAKKKSV